MLKRISITAFAIMCVARAAAADPIVLPGDAPLWIQFGNIEQVNTANNLVVPGYARAAAFGTGTSGNWGVFNVSHIDIGAALFPPHNDIAGPGGSIFNQSSPGQVTGIFYGINFVAGSGGTQATGGRMDLYWSDTDTVSADCLAGNTCAPDSSTVGLFTGGTLLASIDLAPGIIPNDTVTTITSTTNPATQGGSGQADAFGNVNASCTGPCPWQAALNGNWFWVNQDGNGTPGQGPNEMRDLRFSTFFNVDVASWTATAQGGTCVNGGNALLPGPGGTGTFPNPAPLDMCPAGKFGIRSNDPARVFTSAVPEPATVGLLGLGLAALAAHRRRKGQKETGVA